MKRLLPLFLLATPAWAGVDVDHLQLATGAGFLATESPFQRAWDWRAQAAYRWSDSSLVLERGDKGTTVVGARSYLDLSGSLMFGRWVGLGIALPVLLDDGGAIGDLRLVPRVQMVQRQHFGLALLLSLRVPTGDSRKFMGEDGAVFEPRVLLEGRASIVRIALNAGVRVRESRALYDLELGNECFASLAIAVAPKPYLDFLAELHGDTAMDSHFGAAERSPVELLVGVGGGAKGVRAGLAAGVGLVDGIGAPRVRALVTLEVRRPPDKPPVLLASLTPRPQIAAEKPPLPELPDIDDTVPLPDPPEVDAPAVTVAHGRIELSDPIFFDTNRKRIRSRFHGELRQLAMVLQRRADLHDVWIEGHADATGPQRWNLELSRNRAQAVVNFLVAEGIDGARLHPVGFGEARPLVPSPPGIPNDRNRCVHFFTEVEQ